MTFIQMRRETQGGEGRGGEGRGGSSSSWAHSQIYSKGNSMSACLSHNELSLCRVFFFFLKARRRTHVSTPNQTLSRMSEMMSPKYNKPDFFLFFPGPDRVYVAVRTSRGQS